MSSILQLYILITDNSENVVVLRLKESSESKLKGKFSALITFAIHILETTKGERFEEFKSYIITYFSLNSIILDATSYRRVFNQISHEKKWDYMNFIPLLEILGHFIQEETERMCHDYEEAVKGYYATEKCAAMVAKTNQTKMPHTNEPLDVTVHEIQMKLHPHKVSDKSHSYIQSVWDSMSKFFSIPSVKTVVDSMPSLDTEVDCLCATLPQKTSEPLIGQSEESWKKFMEKHSIVKIIFDSGHEYTL